MAELHAEMQEGLGSVKWKRVAPAYGKPKQQKHSKMSDLFN
jgi:hypothetical protein